MSEPQPLEKRATARVAIEGPEYPRDRREGEWPRQERHKLFEVSFEGTPADLVVWLRAMLDQLTMWKEETR